MNDSVVVERNVEATVRDGTVLRADVYVPQDEGPFSTLLARPPYDKSSPAHAETAREMAGRGYLVVVQDVRGRYASDGEFQPGFFSSDHRDAEDGYDAVEWAASLPESNGRVGTFGKSYVGWTQWELAHTRPPHLVCMLPQGISANLLDREFSGVLRIGRVLTWCVNSLAIDARRRDGVTWGAQHQDETVREWTDHERPSGCGSCRCWTSPTTSTSSENAATSRSRRSSPPDGTTSRSAP